LIDRFTKKPEFSNSGFLNFITVIVGSGQFCGQMSTPTFGSHGLAFANSSNSFDDNLVRSSADPSQRKNPQLLQEEKDENL
jgi:hypothetical protein